MPETVLSNTSPIYYLHQIQHLELLQDLYSQILVPSGVVAELAVGRAKGLEIPAVEQIA